MTNIAMARRQVEDAADLGTLLDAAYAAFEEAMSAIFDHPDDTDSAFAAFAFAAAAAADGRDAIAAAPSMPPARLRHQAADTLPDPKQRTEELAAALAGLAAVLASALTSAAETATAAEDRDACGLAARHAREVRRLLAWDQP